MFPWFIPLIGYLLLGNPYLTQPRVFFTATAINLSVATITFFTMDALVLGISTRFSGMKQTGRRILFMFLAFAIVTSSVIISTFWVYTHFSILNYVADYNAIKQILLLNLLANVVSVGIYEGIYSITEWKASTIEKEQLRKANLQSQIDGLKNQVNPHFLFNSLNSLTALISKDPDKAEEFVTEMSQVYRYLLQTNNYETTTLETELKFIQSYYHMLKTRFGNGVSMDLAIDDRYLNRYLPPLTLQLLVENAVKHNIVKSNKPLLIEIQSTPEGRLMIRNNLQRKRTPVASNRVGLSNIAAKYQLLSKDEMEIRETESHFIVTVPLLEQVNS
ncbi:histidine kinase [Nibrella saemangeumensis]|uniref:Histidine kinase n=1 Tax=Nibrella saemangeumensis TaxID=1084526 RepID=A0ABP8MQU6_9BACT